MKPLLKTSLLFLTLFLSIKAYAVEPFGFERWNRPTYSFNEIGVG